MMVVHNELDIDMKTWWKFRRNCLRGRIFFLGNRQFIV